MDDMTEQPGRRERMGSRPWVRSAAMIGGGLVAGGILAGTLTANAATGDTAAAATSYSQAAGGATEAPTGGAPTGNTDPSQPQRSDEQLLTGDTATKVTDVVEAKYPDATIQRVETDSDGVYEAHIVTADGEQLIVQVGEDFSITGTQQFGGR
jgi:predicted  nucleic acid-binding Zn-ribbon protein